MEKGQIILDLTKLPQLLSVITALASLCGIFLTGYRFYTRQKEQDKELQAIQNELTVLCFGVRACLSGLKEQGCNGPVTQALDRLDKHLNQKAHAWEGNE